MIEFIKKNIFVTFIFILTLCIGFLTFLTFIDKSFIKLSPDSLQSLLLFNVILLILFFILIFFEVKNSLKNDIESSRGKVNKKYIIYFSLFTLIPAILVSVFSLFLFSFALEKYLDKKVTTAVNNSYEMAQNYVEEVRNKVEADIVLISLDLNNKTDIFYNNPVKFKNLLLTQKLIRNVDEVHLIDSLGNLIVSSIKDYKSFERPNEKALEMASADNRPLKIINAYENKSAAMIRLDAYIDTYLYIVKFLDVEISNYLKESEEALNFYYTVESKSTGIKVSFILIYILIVTLMLFLSITLAIKFSSRFFRTINNLISASINIGRGDLDTQVPDLETDNELKILNKNFNMMINKLRNQQQKLLINERHEAWEHVARKLAHEIKNPLTPIQLTIDRLKMKYSNSIEISDKKNFDSYLKTIIKQIKQIENLVNEFSDFARMPKPIFIENNLVTILNDNISLLKELDKSIFIEFKKNKEKVLFICDNEQISRVFFNLIKNAIESIQEKYSENNDFVKKIDIDIIDKNDYIDFIIVDNGKGFGFFADKIKDILNPYFTTKKKGSGLGLSIVNKIINDHNGVINFEPQQDGAKIIIRFSRNAN